MRVTLGVLAAFLSVVQTIDAEPESWSQFRGANAGRANPGHKYPTVAGPTQNVLWKTPLPSGHSSPVVHGDRIYLTAVRDKKLLTIALERRTGSILWEVSAPYDKLEKIHQIGSFAQPSPATDGRMVVSYFGSSGLLAYDDAGKLLWHVRLGPFKNDLGAGSSPLIVGDRILVNQDNDLGSFLLCIDKHTGKQIWKTDRSEFTVGYATPLIWEVNGKKQVVVAGTLRAVGYDFDTGKEIWTVRGLSRAVHMSPSLGPDNILYIPAWTGGGDSDDRIDVAPFAEFLAKHDANKNGTLEADEMPEGPLKSRFNLIDRDKSGHIVKEEFEHLRNIFNSAQNRIVAVKPGGVGEITDTHVLWSQRRYLPVVSSPLIHENRVYLMRNGGLLATLDAKTGKLLKHERIPGGGDYYSSPVTADGKIYLMSQAGHLAVVSAQADWKLLHQAKFGEEIFATPALVDGKIYLRTAGHLYCFGE